MSKRIHIPIMRRLGPRGEENMFKKYLTFRMSLVPYEDIAEEIKAKLDNGAEFRICDGKFYIDDVEAGEAKHLAPTVWPKPCLDPEC